MTDEWTTRRRHSVRSTHITDIQNGGPMDDEEDKDSEDPYIMGSGSSRAAAAAVAVTTRRRRRKRNLNHVELQNRKRRIDETDDPPFIVLVLQVGTVLLLLSLVTYYIYKLVYPASSHRSGHVVWSGSHITSHNHDRLKVDHTSGSSSKDDDENDADQSVVDDQIPKEERKHRLDQALKLSELLHKDPVEMNHNHNTGQMMESPPAVVTAKPTTPPLPLFDLSSKSQWDAFGILGTITNSLPPKILHDYGVGNLENDVVFWNATIGYKRQFATLYGGENAARMLLDQSMSTFGHPSGSAVSSDAVPSDIVSTACRLLWAQRQQRSFVMAFGGYSVTTGRGNRHEDSYPFQLQRLLEPLLQAAGIPSLHVLNAAVGGCPSFPYGWCMEHFWGRTTTTNSSNGTMNFTPDVVSWDFGMNEATGGSEGLEAYVRHLLSTYSVSVDNTEGNVTSLSPPPKLIVTDHTTATFRKQLLQEYTQWLHDPVVLHTDQAVQPFLERDEEFRPIGFQRWREFGAPYGAPGQAKHHPAVQEHKLNGWLLTMHFTTALEYMMTMEASERKGTWCPSAFNENDPTRISREGSFPATLPPPVSRRVMNDTSIRYDSYLFGRPQEEGELKTSTASLSWVMDPVQCRTTYQPQLSGNLREIVWNGTVAEDLKVTLPKSQFYYNKGWTFDLSESEKSVKRKLGLYPDGLGFRDSKEAYYGIFESGQMSLLLPASDCADEPGREVPKPGDKAVNWFESIILCQVNERTYDEHPDACNFSTDVSIRVGGVHVPSNTTRMIHELGSVYLGQPICKHLPIPLEAQLTSRKQLFLEENKGGASPKTDQVGLLVDIWVSNSHIVHIQQACSLSHVVWQERRISKV